jgi:hypothetical protein
VSGQIFQKNSLENKYFNFVWQLLIIAKRFRILRDDSYLFLDERLRDEDVDESGTGNVQLADDVIFGNFRNNLGGDFTWIRFDTFPLVKYF